MDNKKLKKLIERTKKKLEWDLCEQPTPGSGDAGIYCDPIQHIHYILMPQGYQVPAADVLHELTHATLAETVSPAFAGGNLDFVSGKGRPTWDEWVDVPAKAATDWFVDGWFVKEAPLLAKEHLNFRISRLLRPFVKFGKEPTGNSLYDFWGLALLAAQSQRYQIGSCGDSIHGELRTAVQLFLSVPENKPTIERLLDLKNRLVALKTPGFLVEYVAEEHAWHLFERQDTVWNRI